MTQRVQNRAYSPADAGEFGPVKIDRRTARAGLEDLAAGFVDFPESGSTEPWTLPYEEVFHVLAGVLTVSGDGYQVVGGPGDVLTISQGVTVVYSGTAGTRAFYALVPASWASDPA